MIEKILKIRNVGTIKNYSFNDPDEYEGREKNSFGEINLIFGRNTYGKTTLTSIFRSFQEGNMSYVEGRRSFSANENESQEVKILYKDKNSQRNEFEIDKNQLANVEIFDNTFIAKNVFNGEMVTEEQKGNLHGTFVGEEVLNIVSELNDIQGDLKDLNEKKKEMKNRLQRCLRQYEIFYDVELSALEKVDVEELDESEIDKQIDQVNAQIKQQENLKDLKTIIKNSPLNQNFQNLLSDFNKKVEVPSVEQQIKEHKEAHWQNPDAPEDFLKKGIELLKDDGNCVFCGQELSEDAKHFVESLQLKFSEKFRELQKSITEKGNKFLEIDIDVQKALFNEKGLDIEQYINIQELKQLKQQINEEIKKKQEDLAYVVDIGEKSYLQYFQDELVQLQSRFQEILEEEAGEEKKEELYKQLSDFNFEKFCFSNEGKDLLRSYTQNNHDRKQKEEQRDSKRQELNKIVENTFNKYKDAINYYLNELRADFELSTFEQHTHMGKSNSYMCHYKFLFYGQYEVEVSNTKRKGETEPEEKPHFRNTLSDSDKRVLAFAFFLAKLSLDDKLDEKIIILDDPFSSFDEKRLDKTVDLLNNIQNENNVSPRQIFVLTHNNSFIAQLYESVNIKNIFTIDPVYDHSEEIVTSKIFYVDDVDSEFLQEEYHRNLNFIDYSIKYNVKIDEAIGKVRKCLEHLIKRKYYYELSKDALNKNTLSVFLREQISLDPSVKKWIEESHWDKEMHDTRSPVQLPTDTQKERLKEFREKIKDI